MKNSSIKGIKTERKLNYIPENLQHINLYEIYWIKVLSGFVGI